MTMSAHPPAQGTGGDDAAVPLAPASELLKLFAKAVRANQLYAANNPMHARAIDAVRAAFPAVWAHTDVLELTVTETAFLSEERPALEEVGRGAESLPWLFYKDGVRTLEMRPGFEGRDLELMLDVVQRARTRRGDDDDLVTLFWEQEFEHFNYRYVELGLEGVAAAPGTELLQGGAYRGGGSIEPPSVVEAVTGPETSIGGSCGTPAASSPFARVDDFDTTLYFLEEEEIAYLQRAIAEDFSTDFRPSVIAALLDTFEQEDDAAVRDEICGILDNLLVLLLAQSQFQMTAYLLREASAAGARARNLLPEHGERLLRLPDRVSDPLVFGQLLQSLEDAPLRQWQDELSHLLSQLRGVALEPLLAHLARTTNAELRAMLESAAARLIAGNTGELVRLIGSTNEAVAMSAVQRAGALRSPAAVAPLAKLLSSPNVGMRRLATAALADIGSSGAMQVVERAVEDDDREVRVIAVRAILERQHRTALPRVERVLKSRVMSESQNTTEKTAFFDTYATLAGDASIGFFDGILNPRGFLTRKEDPQTRACAAMALGRIGSEKAFESLRKAGGDKEIVVRTAAARALRGPA
jgi:hypothetical protein